MITQGLSQHEINLITTVLDEHHVDYHVDAAGGTDAVKVRGGRGDASFYQIEIPSDQYEKLSVTAKLKLESLGIYPEMEAPDFTAEEPKVKSVADATKVRNNMKRFEKIFILVMIAMGLSFIYKVLNNR